MTDISGQARVPFKPGPRAEAASQAPAEGKDPSKSSGSRTSAAPFQIQPIKSGDRWFKLIVYGKHGAGKTELAASAIDVPQMNDVLYIDAESGKETIYDNPRIENWDKIDRIRVTNYKQVAHIQEHLKAHCRARDTDNIPVLKKLQSAVSGVPYDEIADEDVKRYKTIVLDSLTEVEVYCTYGILGIDTDKIISEDIDVAGWPEFRKNNEMVKLLVRAYRDLPLNVIFVCSEQWTQDEHKRFHYTPAMTGKLSAQIQGFVDMVGYLTTGVPQEGKEVPRRMFVQPVATGAKFDAKNRRSVFGGSWFDEPTMAMIMKAVGLVKKDS